MKKILLAMAMLGLLSGCLYMPYDEGHGGGYSRGDRGDRGDHGGGGEHGDRGGRD